MQEKEGSANNIIKGAISLTISGLIVKIIGLVFKVPLSYWLSDEGMSFFNSAYTVYTFFYIICTAGIPKAISIIIAGLHGEERRKDEVYKTAFFVFGIFGAIISLLFFLLSGPISRFIGNRGAYMTMLAIAPSIVFVSLSGVIRGYFNGTMRFMPIAVSEIISGAGKLILGLLFVFLGNRMNLSLELLSALAILGTSLGSVFGFIYLYFCIKKEKCCEKTRQNIRISYFSFKKIIKIAVPITATSILGSLGALIDLALIMNILSNEGYSELQSGILYGNYTTLAIPMLNLVGALIAPISIMLLPIISRYSKTDDKEKMSQSISVSLDIVCMFIIPVAFLYYFAPEEILKIIFEDSSATLAAPLLKHLSVGILFMALSTVINTALEGAELTNIPLISLSIGSVVKVAVSFILIKNNNFGILGAPMATTISYAVGFLISSLCAIFTLGVRLRVLRPIIFYSALSLLCLIPYKFVSLYFLGKGILYSMISFGIFVIIYIIALLPFNYKRVKSIKFSKDAQKNKH